MLLFGEFIFGEKKTTTKQRRQREPLKFKNLFQINFFRYLFVFVVVVVVLGLASYLKTTKSIP